MSHPLSVSREAIRRCRLASQMRNTSNLLAHLESLESPTPDQMRLIRRLRLRAN